MSADCVTDFNCAANQHSLLVLPDFEDPRRQSHQRSEKVDNDAALDLRRTGQTAGIDASDAVRRLSSRAIAFSIVELLRPDRMPRHPFPVAAATTSAQIYGVGVPLPQLLWTSPSTVPQQLQLTAASKFWNLTAAAAEEKTVSMDHEDTEKPWRYVVDGRRKCPEENIVKMAEDTPQFFDNVINRSRTPVVSACFNQTIRHSDDSSSSPVSRVPDQPCVSSPTSPCADNVDALSSTASTPVAPRGRKTPVAAVTSSARCRLETQGLWDKFHRLGLTEMIITKSGRRMFPPLRVTFSGLDQSATYDVMLDVIAVDSRRYRYAYHRSTWVVADRPADGSGAVGGGPAVSAPTPRSPGCSSRMTYRHPDSPLTGRQLTQRTVSFDRVKLTNNAAIDKNGYIVLSSMRKYCPQVRLVRRCTKPDRGSTEEDFATAAAPSFHVDSTRLFQFPGCVFMAVTAYQNQLITKLKIDSNPFAKGFRDFSRFGEFSRGQSWEFDTEDKNRNKSQQEALQLTAEYNGRVCKFSTAALTDFNI